MADETRYVTTDDDIQHGVDDNPNNDPHKAKNLGGAGGAVVGAAAGMAAGPVGAVVGAVVGGVAGAVASKAAVKQIDKMDNDNNVSGVGDGVNYENREGTAYENRDGIAPGNGVPGIQTGGHDLDGTPDERGVTEKLADKLTGDHRDDKTGKPV